MEIKPGILGGNQCLDQRFGDVGEDHGRAVLNKKFSQKLI